MTKKKESVEAKIRAALAYFYKVDLDKITGVHVVKQVSSIVTVVYRDPKNVKRTAELDISKQYMKMFTGESNE